MLLFDFECQDCKRVFEELVTDADALPETCPACSGVAFIKLMSPIMNPTTVIMTYPGSKRLKAGYQHHSICAPAEKKGRQVSMHGAYKKKKKGK